MTNAFDAAAFDSTAFDSLEPQSTTGVTYQDSFKVPQLIHDYSRNWSVKGMLEHSNKFTINMMGLMEKNIGIAIPLEGYAIIPVRKEYVVIGELVNPSEVY